MQRSKFQTFILAIEESHPKDLISKSGLERPKRMELREKKIGYWPYRTDQAGPGDRRRFVFYASAKNISYEIASLDNYYDIVYLTVGCDIYQWLQYKKKYPKTKIVFECADSYYLDGSSFFGLFRGIIKFITRKETKLYLIYKRAIIEMFRVADAVVCSTQIQKDFIFKYNNNVHISLDYFLGDITHYKTNYESGSKLKLVWEGQAYTVQNLLKIKSVFKKLSHKIELHIITDPVIMYPFKIFNKKTSKILSKLDCNQFFYTWEKGSFSKIIADADLAIIPIDKKDKLHWNKPENKLLLFWQIGIPVLTSPTPAYSKVMEATELPCLCNTPEDWAERINDYIRMNDNERKELVEKAKIYVENNHAKNKIFQNWDEIFLSLNM